MIPWHFDIVLGGILNVLVWCPKNGHQGEESIDCGCGNLGGQLQSNYLMRFGAYLLYCLLVGQYLCCVA